MLRFEDETIHIDNLRVECIIGINPGERETPQPILISVSFRQSFEAAAASDSIESTLNYSEVAQAMREFVVDGRFQLLEALARHLGTALCERFNLDHLTLHVRKLQAVSGSDGPAVSLTLVREHEE